jgi:hypothetical protein
MMAEIIAYGSIMSLLILLIWAIIQIHRLGQINISDVESMRNRMEERTRYKQAIEDMVLPSKKFMDIELVKK